MKKVIILSGVSGSGKSRLAGKKCDELPYMLGEGSKVVVCSADLFFYDKDGNYNFNGSKLGDAHASCFRNFIDYLHVGFHDTVIVDNTNTTESEIAPYMLGAAAFGYEAEIITYMCRNDDDVKVCAGRNQHGVPYAGVLAQHKRILNRRLPPWWNAKGIWIGDDANIES